MKRRKTKHSTYIKQYIFKYTLITYCRERRTVAMCMELLCAYSTILSLITYASFTQRDLAARLSVRERRKVEDLPKKQIKHKRTPRPNPNLSNCMPAIDCFTRVPH